MLKQTTMWPEMLKRPTVMRWKWSPGDWQRDTEYRTLNTAREGGWTVEVGTRLPTQHRVIKQGRITKGQTYCLQSNHNHFSLLHYFHNDRIVFKNRRITPSWAKLHFHRNFINNIAGMNIARLATACDIFSSTTTDVTVTSQLYDFHNHQIVFK